MSAAVFGDVTSANVVGYQSMKVDDSGYFMTIGVNLSNMATDDGAYVIDDTSIFGAPAVEGDQLFSWNANVWDINQFDKLPEGDGWMLTYPGTFEVEYLDTIKIAKGDTIWCAPVDVEESVTVSGEVAAFGEQTVEFDLENEDGQFLFPLVNPFPIDTTWGDINTFTVEGDQMFTWDPIVWDINQFDKLPVGDGWMLTHPSTFEVEYLTDETAVAIKAGEAALFAPSQSTVWTVTLNN